MTKEEADKKVEALELQDKAEKLRTDVFCPLINGSCRTSCVCYAPAQTWPLSRTDNNWTVYPGFCDNAMFTKDRNVQNNY